MSRKLNYQLGKILNKSTFNTQAAELLIEHNLFAPSVHCSYYAVFQYLKHKFSKLKNVSYEEIDVLTKDKDSHVYVIDGVIDVIMSKGHQKKDVETLRNDIYSLKFYRKKADYLNIDIFSNDSEKCLQNSNDIIKCLKKYN